MASRLVVAITTIVLLLSLVWLWQGSDDPLSEQTHWYQMIWQGENVGYMSEESVIDGDQYSIRTETRVKTISQGQPYGFRESKYLTFSTLPPYPLINSYYRYEAPGQLIETKLDNIGDVLIGSRQNNHELLSISLPFANLTLDRFRSINHWIADKPDSEAILRVILPEVASAEVTETIYQVEEISAEAYKVSYRAANQANSREIELDHTGDVLAYRFGSVIQLERVDDKDDLVLAGDVDLYRSKLLALDKPLGDTANIREISIQAEPWFVDYVSVDNRQTLAGNILSLAANVSAIPGNKPDTEVAEFNLLPETRLKLIEMAQSAIAGKTDKIAQLTALREYVSDYLTDGARVSVTTIESLLESPEGDCTEHTQLFNALANVLNFHSRTVNGLVYLGDSDKGFAGHQWSEVYVDGYWLSFDPTWNINSLTATHIRLNQDKAASLYRYIKTETNPGVKLIAVK